MVFSCRYRALVLSKPFRGGNEPNQIGEQFSDANDDDGRLRLQPIRTAAEVPLAFAVSTHETFVYQQIGPDVWKMRKLGMTLQAIGNELGVDCTYRVRSGSASASTGRGDAFNEGEVRFACKFVSTRGEMTPTATVPTKR